VMTVRGEKWKLWSGSSPFACFAHRTISPRKSFHSTRKDSHWPSPLASGYWAIAGSGSLTGYWS
jgi:hypothetical protein